MSKYKKVFFVLLLILSGFVCGIGLDMKSWAIGLPGGLGIAYSLGVLITNWIKEY